jgi:ABC-2 type transport system ATP-binding protein
MAVNDVSIRVRAGEIYGFLGLNGAGKTTTIRMLLGMIRPTAGEIRLVGQTLRPGQQGPWDKVGYLVEVPSAYPELTVGENIEITRRLRGLHDKKVTNQILERLQLGAYQDVRAENLSLGNAQRLGLAKALIHQPDVLILDEPTNGLDPAGILEVRELLQELAHQHGTTVFISSHILSEIALMATRIGIIHQGLLLQEMDIDQLERLRRKRLHLQFRQVTGVIDLLARLGYKASLIDKAVIEIDDQQAVEWPEQVAKRLVEAGLLPMMLRVDEENLESYFLRTIAQSRAAS